MLNRISSFSGPFSKLFSMAVDESYLPPTGLILKYEFSVGSTQSYSGTESSIVDLVGNSNATLVGGTYSKNGYLRFDGVDDYIITDSNLSSYLNPDPSSTIFSNFSWIYPMDNGVIVTELGQNYLGGSWHYSQIEIVSGIVNFGVWSGASISGFQSNIGITFSNWYNIGVTYDGVTLSGYINGQLAGSLNVTRNNSALLYYSLGSGDITNLGDGGYSKMRLGAFYVYNTALTNSQVLNLYNSQKDSYLDIVKDNLNLYLSAGDIDSYPGSGITWNDLSSNFYTTTLVNSVLFSTDNGGSFVFGSGDYVDTNQSLASESFTVGAWFRTTSPGIKMILSKETNAGNPWNYRIWMNGGQIYADMSQITSQSSLSSPLTSYNDGNWHYVMFTRDDSSWYLYVDGLQVNTKSDTYIGSVVNSQEVWIGRSAYLGGSYQFIGDISEVMIYDRVLSSSEILQNYNATKIRFIS